MSKNEPVKVKLSDLPISCPTDEVKLWSEHPRVFIELSEKDKENNCPYCGTKFILEDEKAYKD